MTGLARSMTSPPRCTPPRNEWRARAARHAVHAPLVLRLDVPSSLLSSVLLYLSCGLSGAPIASSVVAIVDALRPTCALPPCARRLISLPQELSVGSSTRGQIQRKINAHQHFLTVNG